MPDIAEPVEKSAATPPKLLDQVRDRLRLKHYSLRTEQAYVGWIRRYIIFHKRHPAEMGKPAHHVDDKRVQRTVKRAVGQAGLVKLVTPHTLRIHSPRIC